MGIWWKRRNEEYQFFLSPVCERAVGERKQFSFRPAQHETINSKDKSEDESARSMYFTSAAVEQ